jgi:hypothetical protein
VASAWSTPASTAAAAIAASYSLCSRVLGLVDAGEAGELTTVAVRRLS